MSNEVSLTVSGLPALYSEDHATGDIVVVNKGGRSYYGKVLCKMTNGGYLIDPIAFERPSLSQTAV